MAKNSNTVAKRKSSASKKPKTVAKPGRTAQPKPTDDGDQAGGEELSLSPPEKRVLSLFRRYLMTPGKMLCLGSADLATYKTPLLQLTDKGLLVAESFQAGYSLTPSGFAAMENGARDG